VCGDAIPNVHEQERLNRMEDTAMPVNDKNYDPNKKTEDDDPKQKPGDKKKEPQPEEEEEEETTTK
jgi:hypothetical protein